MNHPPTQHSAIVLFYKYFPPSDYPTLHQYPRYFEERLLTFAKGLCERLQLKGRLLLSAEGVNGTVSAPNVAVLADFRRALDNFELIRDCGLPPGVACPSAEERLFTDIDWKESSNANGDILEPFPDLKVSIVKEVISSGGTVGVEELEEYTGKHLSPREFHQTVLDNPDTVLIDVRNTFEYDIGHFVHPVTGQAAIDPSMVTFSSFDPVFCANEAERLKGKKVLMYCTGGIRCVKASAMLRKRGVEDVSQLSGGIHRYLEEYGEDGFFRGRNFVYDQRVALTPAECKGQDKPAEVIGHCVECRAPFDEICGSRVCTVCRDLVLVCPSCRAKLREYHCRRHAAWKTCYFTFLNVFSDEELKQQQSQLSELREESANRNIRKTLSRQVEKIDQRRVVLARGARVDTDAPRRCRTCFETLEVCDGRCWGFWKSQQQAQLQQIDRSQLPELAAIAAGDRVQPGPHWNELRLGDKLTSEGQLRKGAVVEVKPWGAGATEWDCAAVLWEDQEGSDRRGQPLLYRWGVVALNGQRMYDLEKA